VEVGSGSRPLCGLENRRPKGYAGSSPVPSAIQVQQLTASSSSSLVSLNQLPSVLVASWRDLGALLALAGLGRNGSGRLLSESNAMRRFWGIA
jgi:hypothetical protein